MKSFVILNNFKTKEKEWNDQKKALVNEIQFLKSLLTSNDQINAIMRNDN